MSFAAMLCPRWVHTYLIAAHCTEGSLLGREDERLARRVRIRHPTLEDWEPKWRLRYAAEAKRRLDQIHHRAGNVLEGKIAQKLRQVLAHDLVEFVGLLEGKDQLVPHRLGWSARFDPVAGTISNSDGKVVWTDVTVRRRQASRSSEPSPPLALGAVGKRKKPSGLTYEESDQPLIAEMQRLVACGQARGHMDAARMVVKDAAGSGSEESKIKRLLRKSNDASHSGHN